MVNLYPNDVEVVFDLCRHEITNRLQHLVYKNLFKKFKRFLLLN